MTRFEGSTVGGPRAMTEGSTVEAATTLDFQTEAGYVDTEVPTEVPTEIPMDNQSTTAGSHGEKCDEPAKKKIRTGP